MTGSGEVFFTETAKVTVPPGVVTVVGVASLVTSIVGFTSLTVTVALASSETAVCSSSWPAAVTVSVSESPASPLTVAVKVQV